MPWRWEDSSALAWLPRSEERRRVWWWAEGGRPPVGLWETRSAAAGWGNQGERRTEAAGVGSLGWLVGRGGLVGWISKDMERKVHLEHRHYYPINF